MRNVGLLFVLCWGLLTCQLGAAQPLVLDAQSSQVFAGNALRWLTAPATHDTKQILQQLARGGGEAVSGPYPSFGYGQSTHWLLLEVDNHSALSHWFVEAGRPMTDALNLYLFDAQQQLVARWHNGSRVLIQQRPFPSQRLIFPITLPQGKSWLLFNAYSSDLLEVPVTLLTPERFYTQSNDDGVWTGVFFGTLAILCLYNLLLFFSIRDRSYLFYVLYLGGFGLFLLDMEGLALRWVWPHAPDWNAVSLPSIALFAMVFSFLFARDFLQLPRYMPRTAKALLWCAAISLLLSLISPFYIQAMASISSIVIIPWPFFVLFIAFIVLRKGYAIAGYFLLSFSFIGVATILYALMTLGLIHNSWWLENSLKICIIIEALLLSFALAHRMTLIKRQSEKIQLEAQQQLEHKVQERTQELHTALNARSQFLAVMSHEIRTPLNGMLGTLELFKDSSLSAAQQQQLGIIESSGNSLLQLINDILDYSRIEAGKMPLTDAAFSITQLAHECCHLFEQKATLNGSQLRLTLDDELGELARGDALRVRQLLVNLISNAVKFTHAGHIDISIRRATDNPDYVHFAVTDTGIGIAHDKLSLLFELFEQADNSTSRQYGGTGLGLAVCRQLVEIMGGEIGVTSQLGQGSTFWFHLPLPIATMAPAELVETAPQQRSARLLIVDDNNINLMVAEGLCKKLGHEVETCESGSEAIAALLNDTRPFDAVLMDCEMPIMDGFATTREIIRLQKEGRIRNIPIVALTAHAVPDKIRACHEAGMVLHIAKPVNLEKLKASLNQLLNKQPSM